MEITIEYKSESLKIKVNENGNVLDIKNQFKKIKKIPVIQQQLSFKQKSKQDPKIVLNDELQPIKLLKLNPDTILVVKNLGNQIVWSTVFYIEYLGPMIFYGLAYFLGGRSNYTKLQNILFVMGILHYLKRQLQTIFVHVFSRNSMPFHRALINMFHYWILFGLFVGVELFHFWKDPNYSDTTIYVLVALWAIFQFLNLQCHRVVANFRKVTPEQLKAQKQQGYVNPTKIRKIPYGWGFDLVSSANYLWESLGWITFSILSRCYTSYFFTALSIYQMLDWAIKKHKNYRKQFKDYPKNRKAMFPFII